LRDNPCNQKCKIHVQNSSQVRITKHWSSRHTGVPPAHSTGRGREGTAADKDNRTILSHGRYNYS
jgi:hypothetical protein